MRGSRRKTPEPISPESLERAVLAHLGRYETSAANLRNVLERRIRRAERLADPETGDSGVPAQAREWAEAAVERAQRLGLVDDQRFGQALIRRLRRRGTSGRALRQKLLEKGVPEALVRELLEAEADGDEMTAGDRELAAAGLYVRRRRLGPFRAASEREPRRKRDLAALARAGFTFDIAARVIDAESPEDLPTLPARSMFAS
jgi:regulatory protein